MIELMHLRSHSVSERQDVIPTMVQFLFFLCSFGELVEWAVACKSADTYAGFMLSIVGTPEKMSAIAKIYLGPFGKW